MILSNYIVTFVDGTYYCVRFNNVIFKKILSELAISQHQIVL